MYMYTHVDWSSISAVVNTYNCHRHSPNVIISLTNTHNHEMYTWQQDNWNFRVTELATYAFRISGFFFPFFFLFLFSYSEREREPQGSPVLPVIDAPVFIDDRMPSREQSPRYLSPIILPSQDNAGRDFASGARTWCTTLPLVLL